MNNNYGKNNNAAMDKEAEKNSQTRILPWYDDRVRMLVKMGQEEPDAHERDYDCDMPDGMFGDMEPDFGDDGDWDCDLDEEECPTPIPEKYNTPKKIYDYLNTKVWKQEDAKRAASVLAYNAFVRGIKENAMFVGPTGCGKTFIWRCLQEIFPDRIVVVDGSNLTQEGWKGDKKWSSLFYSPVFYSRRNTILVIDEADKMLAPKHTSKGDNTSQSIAAEGLKLMEGMELELESGFTVHRVDTAKISFVLCGAFSNKAQEIAEQDRGSSIGFGAEAATAKAYDKPLDEQDLIDFGVMPEFMGRMQRIVNLESMTLDDFYKITNSTGGPISRIQEQYGAEIRITRKKRMELAQRAYKNGLGIRGIENQIRELLDDALFKNCDRQCFKF